MNEQFQNKIRFEEPKNIEIKTFFNYIEITRKWSNIFHCIQILFILFLLIFPLLGLVKLMIDYNSMYLFVVLILFLSVILTIYYIIAITINRTYIFANNKVIIVRHKPIPFPTVNNTRFRVNEIERLYIKVIRRRKKGKLKDMSYELRAKIFNNSDKKILKCNFTESEVQFIKTVLEDYLNIK